MAAVTGDDRSGGPSGPASSPESRVPSSDAVVIDSEAPTRQLSGFTARFAAVLAIGISAYAIYWVLAPVPTHFYRISFLLLALVLTFLEYPARRAAGAGVTWIDWTLIGITVLALGWPILDLDLFVYRAANPTTIDLVCGLVTIGLALEGTRRTVGWILPGCAIAFLVYAYAGPVLDAIGLGTFAHRGYDLNRIVGTLYLTLDGLFGLPLDVAATYIILFTLYGAVLQHSGAGSFFLDWSLAAMRGSAAGSSPGRATTLASVLLGTVSGSGVATTVTLGSVAWPLLNRAGYPPHVAGAILSAGGIGAIMMPPALGAAAFLIAEFLKIGYFQVLAMAIVPALLYYLSIVLMIEGDAHRLTVSPAALERRSFIALTRSGWYHFLSLVTMVGMLASGFTAFRAVFWAMVVAAAASFLKTETALTPRRALDVLKSGALGMLPIAATTATAGIIVGVVTLTGLGLKMAGLIVALAGGQLIATVVYAAIAVLLVGLAVPVTASYIIAAVMIAPALVQMGIAPVAAHMFVFYYAVLSEVSPPTALSPFAAAAITGGDPLRTMMTTWRYTLPAFLVPFVFTLSGDGLGVLMQTPFPAALLTSLKVAAGVAAVAGGAGGWLFVPLTIAMRVALVAVGLVVMFI
jgi:TRAP transporter 4TM/12TM fusion protein